MMDMDEDIDFTLMGNILRRIDRKYVMRSFDLKGSTHQREVLKGEEAREEGERIGRTLKDVDFERLEGKIWVSKEDAGCLRRVIEADSIFF
jgi:hypothetical protein